MAFTQETFAPVGANSTDAAAIYSYRSDDTQAAIAATGYFTDKRFQLEEGDIILTTASDGSGFAVVQSDTSTVVFGL